MGGNRIGKSDRDRKDKSEWEEGERDGREVKGRRCDRTLLS